MTFFSITFKGKHWVFAFIKIMKENKNFSYIKNLKKRKEKKKKVKKMGEG